MVNAIVLTGHGLNCEVETAYALEKAMVGKEKVVCSELVDIVHVDELMARPSMLEKCQILVFSGGFSYGDHTGSGKALAYMFIRSILEDLYKFVERDTLTLGVCNGFQVLTQLGLVPNLTGNGYDATVEVGLTYNEKPRYSCRWVDVAITNESPWTKGMWRASMPIAHGEGRFYADDDVLEVLKSNNQIAGKYVLGDACHYQDLPKNPNGSLEDIAAITDRSGRVLGMMPHPERAIRFTQRPDWCLEKEKYKRRGEPIPEEGPGLKLFQNAVEYFR